MDGTEINGVDRKSTAADMPIDVVENGGTEVDTRPAPSALKKKDIGSVQLDQTAAAQLQAFMTGSRPAIGLVHGSLSGQGAVLIKRFSELAKDPSELCKWNVSPLKHAGPLLNDAIGFIIMESESVNFRVDLEGLKRHLPGGLERILLATSTHSVISDQHLLLRTSFDLYNGDMSVKLRSLPFFKSATLTDLNGFDQHGVFTAEAELVNRLMERVNSQSHALRQRLMNLQGREHQRAISALLSANGSAHIDRMLLELRQSINQRICSLERTWNAKRQKTEEQPKLRGHISQLVLKEFQAANASLAPRPHPVGKPDVLYTVMQKANKSTAGSSNANAPAKKKPSAKPPTPSGNSS